MDHGGLDTQYTSRRASQNRCCHMLVHLAALAFGLGVTAGFSMPSPER
uniref:Uncharacterized protein n=1 Tax=Parascaris equorum TaxID=6256 RepID=A0A914R837_PAREQ